MLRNSIFSQSDHEFHTRHFLQRIYIILALGNVLAVLKVPDGEVDPDAASLLLEKGQLGGDGLQGRERGQVLRGEVQQHLPHLGVRLEGQHGHDQVLHFTLRARIDKWGEVAQRTLKFKSFIKI